jgi:hypothetical protein
VRKTQLSLLAFLGQDMTLESVLSFDLTSARKLETFLCTGFGFHFRHLLPI